MRMELKCYKFLIAKAYFDKGMALTNYVKYLIAFFGIASADVKSTMLIAFGYAIFCYVLGRVWFKYKLIETEIEINNIFNPFVREIRTEIKNGKIFKSRNQ